MPIIYGPVEANPRQPLPAKRVKLGEKQMDYANTKHPSQPD